MRGVKSGAAHAMLSAQLRDWRACLRLIKYSPLKGVLKRVHDL
ncbi:hypothetical protein [uncultured Gammaproteobacteria bacterium]|nr:hypothetical protein [uncultured Gammaproteobacteria bacterium]